MKTIEVTNSMFVPDDELVKFATQFSEKYKCLTGNTAFKSKFIEGKNYQQVFGDYFSENNTYHIQYFDGLIKDTVMQQKLNTNVRVAHQTGVIQASKEKLLHKECNPDFVFYIIIWCMCMTTVKPDYAKADFLTTNYYLTTGRSIKNLLSGFLHTIESGPSSLTEIRRRQILEQLEGHE